MLKQSIGTAAFGLITTMITKNVILQTIPKPPEELESFFQIAQVHGSGRSGGVF